MGVRLSYCSSWQISCYRNAEVTWISKGGAHLSGRVKSCSLLGTVNSQPSGSQAELGGWPPLQSACPTLPGTPQPVPLGQGWGREEESEAPTVCESGCLLGFCTLSTSPHSVLAPCWGLPTVLTPNIGIWPWRWSQVTWKRAYDSHILSGYVSDNTQGFGNSTLLVTAQASWATLWLANCIIKWNLSGCLIGSIEKLCCVVFGWAFSREAGRCKGKLKRDGRKGNQMQ